MGNFKGYSSIKEEKKMKEIISTDKAPAAIGPYSQAVKVGNLLFTSGMIPIDPATNTLVEGGIERAELVAADCLGHCRASINGKLCNIAVESCSFLPAK